jgi:hypothetical protein
MCSCGRSKNVAETFLRYFVLLGVCRAWVRVAQASRESLAGRFERLTLSHWPAASLATAFHLSPQEAAINLVFVWLLPWRSGISKISRTMARLFARCHHRASDRSRRAAARLSAAPALLRQVFAIAAGSPVQIVFLQKLQWQLQDSGAIETVANYLALLEDAYLIAPLEKYSTQVLRRRASPPKLVTLNNACLVFAINRGQQVTYWREEPLEIDALPDGSWGK